MQQVLFSAENTVQGVFLCILTAAINSKSPATNAKIHQGNWEPKTYKYGFYMPAYKVHNETELEVTTT